MRKRAFVGLAVAAAVAVPAVPAIAATHKTKGVTVGDDFFKSKSITVSKGTTVKWTWKGKAPHNVTVEKGPAKFASKTQNSGTFSKKLTKAGTYKIECTIHDAEGMVMTVKVK